MVFAAGCKSFDICWLQFQYKVFKQAIHNLVSYCTWFFSLNWTCIKLYFNKRNFYSIAKTLENSFCIQGFPVQHEIFLSLFIWQWIHPLIKWGIKLMDHCQLSINLSGHCMWLNILYCASYMCVYKHEGWLFVVKRSVNYNNMTWHFDIHFEHVI